MEDDPPYFALKARLVQKTGDVERGTSLASDAVKRFAPLPGQDEYQLYWFRIAARIAGDDALLLEADAVARTRATQPEWHAEVGGEFPDVERKPGEDDE
jgi:hypothetical protein